MYVQKHIKQKFKLIWVAMLCIVTALSSNLAGIEIKAEVLESQNYTIKDAGLNTGGSTLDSDTYSMIASLGDTNADSRLVSGSYELKSGFPNGMLANVPIVRCIETTTTAGTTACTQFPNTKGAQGECGNPGCYDRAKIEIDPQANPYDALYLVQVTNVTDNVVYYLKSDHTLGATYDASNFMTICQLQGRDDTNPDCDNVGDSGWNSNLQSINIFGLNSNIEYEASAQALNGDFTGTRFSETKSSTTSSPQLIFDIDIASESQPSADNAEPYAVSLGQIPFNYPTTANNLIWFNTGSNIINGIGIYIRGDHNGLFSTSKNATIPSESEDLANDSARNGGFGIKTYNYETSDSSLGPLQKSSTYNTAGANIVGNITTNNNLLFFTNNLSGNKGPIYNGRAAIYLQARASANTPVSSDYSTLLTVSVVGNY